MTQLKQAILQAVVRSGPILCRPSKHNASPFQHKADHLKKMYGKLPDFITPMLMAVGRCKSEHEIAPYLLAIHQMRPDLRIPKSPLFVKAVALLEYIYCTKSEAHPDAPISPGYEIVPASDAARKENVAYREKHGMVYVAPKSKLKRNPNVVGRFTEPLGY